MADDYLVSININRQVEVTLTEAGRQMYVRDFLDLGIAPPSRDELSKPIRLPLHEVMRVFGPHVSLGRKFNPFEGNNIMLLPGADS